MTNENLVRTVMVDGQELDLGQEVTAEKARQILAEYGTEISSSATAQINNGTVEFVEPRGQNGTVSLTK